MTVFWGTILGILILPIAPLIEWTRSYYLGVDERLEKERTPLQTYKGVLVPFLIILLHFGKGFFIPWLCNSYFFVSNLTVGIVTALTLASDIWLPLSPRYSNYYWYFTILGVYTYMSPSFIVILPLLFMAALLICNSISLGVLATSVSMFIPIWIFNLETHFLAINTVLCVVLLLAFRNQIVQIMDGEKETLLRTFKNRN